jgi:hypothetical protein
VDTDGDGYSDGAEAKACLNPIDPNIPSLVASGFGWNYVSDRDTLAGLLPTDIAGLFPMMQWNNAVAGLNAGSELDFDHDGDNLAEGFVIDVDGNNLTSGSGTTVSWASNTNWNTNNGNLSGDSKLMNGYADDTDATHDQVTITNIPYAEYDVVVYFGSDGNGRTGAIGLLDGSLLEIGAFGYTTFSAAGGFGPINYAVTTDPVGNPNANTAVFKGVTEPTISIEVRRGDNNSGLHGFQIIDRSAVSGPSANLVVRSGAYNAGAGTLTVDITGVVGTVYVGVSTDGQNFVDAGFGPITTDQIGAAGPVNPGAARVLLVQLFDAPLPPAP